MLPCLTNSEEDTERHMIIKPKSSVMRYKPCWY